MIPSQWGRWRGFRSALALLLGSNDEEAALAALYNWPTTTPAVLTFLSAALDAKTVGATVQLCPALAGYLISSSLVQAIYDDDAAGTISGAATAKIGTNGAHDNLFAATASFPVGTGIVPTARRVTAAAITIPATGKELVELTSAPVAEITVGATGSGLVANVRFVTRLCLVKASEF